ncbi:hypothetical protein GGS24DRAFT_501115 [Hypoxylon argillaceum]|nr:hypothetical protein GGS24DRAFT_501115 [Hypoxylon argillaceum]
MDSDFADSSLFKTEWPDGNIYLTPPFLKSLQERLILLKTRFRHFIQTIDPEVGIDLDWLLVRITEPAFLTVQYIANEVPPILPVDPDLVFSTSTLASQLQAVIGDDETPDFLSHIESLPNPVWDDVFKGYCRLLESSIAAYLIGDSPTYQVELTDASEPHRVYRIVRDLIAGLSKYPFLRNYHKRLLRKLECSRSGVIYTEFWTKQILLNSDPTLKHMIDTEGLDSTAHKPLKRVKIG